MPNTIQNKSRYYISYFSIPGHKYLQKTSYFEQHIKGISQLQKGEKHLLYKSYADSLYNLKGYEKFLLYADDLTLDSLDQTLEKDEAHFVLMLLRKAIALDKIGDYQNSLYVIKELIKIKPDNKDYQKKYKKICKNILRRSRKKFRTAIAIIFCVLLLLYFSKTVFINSFYPEYLDVLNTLSICIIGAGLFIILFNEFKLVQVANKSLKQLMTSLPIR